MVSGSWMLNEFDMGWANFEGTLLVVILMCSDAYSKLIIRLNVGFNYIITITISINNYVVLNNEHQLLVHTIIFHINYPKKYYYHYYCFHCT